MSTSARLTVRNVSKSFGAQTVLRDLSLDIAAGEIHALVGHNGSGKSTFVKLLSGYHQPDPGAEATLDGEPFALGSATEAKARGLRFVHQDLGLIPTLDAVDNVLLGLPYPTRAGGRIDWPAARKRTREMLGSLGFDFAPTRPLSTLTATQKTGVAIARAMQSGASPTRVLVLDEPTAALPAPDVAVLRGVVRTLQEQGIAILYISHHLDEILTLARRVTVLRDGAVVTTAPTLGLDEAQLITLMIGEAISAQPTATHHPDRQADPVLRVRELRTRTLDGIDVELWPGEVVGVAGIDGSGREELAAALFGGVARRGTVHLDGRVLPAERPDLAAARGAGLVPADRAADAALTRMSVNENLTVASVRTRLRGVLLDASGERRETNAWIGRLSVVPRRPNAPIETLSGGNQQKVIVARWLRTAPKLLILDEPTKGVDAATVGEIWRLVSEAAASGAAVLACSSHTDELAGHCQRVLVLRSGRIVTELTGGQLDATTIDALALSATGEEPAWAR